MDIVRAEHHLQRIEDYLQVFDAAVHFLRQVCQVAAAATFPVAETEFSRCVWPAAPPLVCRD